MYLYVNTSTKHIKYKIILCYKAIITLQASSGFARTEVCNLTIKDFIEATNEYHTSYTIQDILKELLPNMYRVE